MVITMAKLDEKLQRFEDAVLSQAKQRCDEILSGVEQVKKRELTTTEDAALSNAYELIQGEVTGITVESAREISQRRFAQKQEYLHRRAALEKSIFDNVKQRIIAYTRTEEYKSYLKAAAEKLKAEFAGKDVTLSLMPGDQPLEQLVRNSFQAPCKVVFTDAITLGGIVLTDNSNGYISDLSLDTVLNDQRDWFYQNCRL
ncbi:hypothetical protein SAMN05192585_11462 [Acetanaerobacterium elongatum]|uniref:H+-ATPase subunit E/Vma4 n=2 Tax=Acetanaerobacterium elongatum TaxID=258515 RepID=A0A1G9ZWI3_9FIRM|nr:hypothetical protein SAMN05192585_11462 [Acetanaerobacterium elongatum]